MADEPTPTPTPTPAPLAQPPTTPPPAPEPPATGAPDEKLGEPGLKALQAEREARAAAEKAQRDLEARVKEFEDRDKSDTQRLADENAALKEQNAKATREAMVTRVAMTHGLTADDLDLLHGDTEEQLTSRAQRLAELRAAATAAQQPPPATPAPGQRPVEQLRPGATPTAPQSEDDVVYARLFGADAK